jgi:hypothetical protein
VALPYNSIESLTTEYVIPVLVDNLFKSNPIFLRFNQKGRKYQGGLSIDQPLQYGRNSASGSYSGYDTLSTTPNEKYTRASFSWKQNYVSIPISGLDQIKNAGKEAVIDYLKSEMENARMTLEDNLGYQLFSLGTSADTATYGRGANGLTGLLSAVDDGTTVDTYGGIARLTNTWWKANLTNASATPITLKATQGWIGTVTDGAVKPDLAICAQTIFDHYWGLFQPQQRFQEGDLAKAGFSNLLVSGVALTVDPHCSSTDLWLLNTRFLDFIINSQYNFKFVPFRRPTNQDAEVAQILVAGNLSSSNCRYQHRIKNLDTTL